MNPEENTIEYVHTVMYNEGFDYAFCHYETFKKVKDKKFHTLRKAYLKAQKDLENYVLKNSSLDDVDM